MRNLILAALLLLAQLSAQPAKAAERILALTPHVCEILFAIGAGDDVVGAGEYCDYPEAVRSLPRVANHRQIYIEAALRLRPTMAVGLRDNLPGLARLGSAGVKLVSTNPLTVQDMLADMLRLGEATGHDGAAQAAVHALRQRLQAMKQMQPDVHRRVYYEIWHDPLMAAGGASLISNVLDELGLVNVFADVQMEGPRVSVESVLLARPDIIMLSSETDIAARKAFWHRWFGENTPRFVIADADLLHRPGPRLIEGMAALQSALGQTRE
ncbi:MAG: helical backbone metal receptor [Mariprofundaceae bacterium]|nr:helical backbone metal receptor [Mariprofundaceae bacterium]